MPVCLHIVVEQQYQAKDSRERAGCACSRCMMEIVSFFGGWRGGCFNLKGVLPGIQFLFFGIFSSTAPKGHSELLPY